MAQEGWKLEHTENSTCPPPSKVEHPALCLNNCGLVGCPSTGNLCASCYQTLQAASIPPFSTSSSSSEKSDVVTDLASHDPIPLQASSVPPSSTSSSSSEKTDVLTDLACHDRIQEHIVSVVDNRSSEDLVALLSKQLDDGSVPAKPQGNRCMVCRKRLGLSSGFKCRCGDMFCGLHRYSDRHDCSFDYKAAARAAIAKANPVIVRDKIGRRI